MPQNDVLAHPRTKAFLSHVGINSFYEVRLSLQRMTAADKQTSTAVNLGECHISRVFNLISNRVLMQLGVHCRHSTMEGQFWRCPSSETSRTTLIGLLER